MIAAYTAAGIRAAERYHLDRLPDGVLMSRAAWRIAAVAADRLGRRGGSGGPGRQGLPGRQVVLLVGVGNNGGDALYAGVHLRRRGLMVTAVLTDPHRAHPAGLRALARAGGKTLAADDMRVGPAVDTADLVIDGLVGIGARPPLSDRMAALVDRANSSPALRLAIDLPSGIDPDTGIALGASFAADVTVTMGGHKTGLLLAASAGEVVVAEIGMDPAQCDPPVGVDTEVLESADAARLLPVPGRADNKFSLGVTGIVAGSDRYPGAALLAVGGAVCLRPGLVRFAGHASDAVVRRWPEVVACSDPRDAGRVQAWVVGPGMGTDGAALARLREVLAADVPVLVDADGLTLLASVPSLLAGRTRRGAATVLTPHAGEFARLFADLDPEGEGGRVAAVRAAAVRSGAVILLKGHRTVIADPAGRALINLTGTPHLATAGSGDVLAGIIGALLSAGVDPIEAAALGAQVHSLAGGHAAARAEAGASALLNSLPAVLAELLAAG